MLFAETAAGLGIRCRRIRPFRPQTNGKVERFNRTLLEERAYARLYRSNTERGWAFARWLRFYRHHRPHTALDGLTPMAVLRQQRWWEPQLDERMGRALAVAAYLLRECRDSPVVDGGEAL